MARREGPGRAPRSAERRGIRRPPGGGGARPAGRARRAPRRAHRTPSPDPVWGLGLPWPGGGGPYSRRRGLVVDQLRLVEPGHYLSTRPVPAYGNWKTVLRVHDGRMLAALPIYLPDDRGIDAAGVPAPDEFTRPFVSEITVLQRERSFDHPAWLLAAASLVVLVCSLLVIGALSWGAARINLAYRSDVRAPQPVRS